MKILVKMTIPARVVPVRQYKRYRLGRWEQVIQHLRSLPRK